MICAVLFALAACAEKHAHMVPDRGATTFYELTGTAVPDPVFPEQYVLSLRLENRSPQTLTGCFGRTGAVEGDTNGEGVERITSLSNLRDFSLEPGQAETWEETIEQQFFSQSRTIVVRYDIYKPGCRGRAPKSVYSAPLSLPGRSDV